MVLNVKSSDPERKRGRNIPAARKNPSFKGYVLSGEDKLYVEAYRN